MSGEYYLIFQACDLAQKLHHGQTRRESGASFFESHLTPVATMVAESGGDSIAIASAWLHDALEDIGGPSAQSIRAVSPMVLAHVMALSEVGDSWEERKASYLQHIPLYDEHELLVSLCDKIVTGRDFISEWSNGKFGKHPARIVWFYGEIAKSYASRASQIGREQIYTDLLKEITLIAAMLTQLVGTGSSVQ